jgi:hypothetical protein
MDDYHFSNIKKVKIKFVPNHIGENKKLTFKKKLEMFYVVKINCKRLNESIFELTLNLQRF